jgi:hypothetical protein
MTEKQYGCYKIQEWNKMKAWFKKLRLKRTNDNWHVYEVDAMNDDANPVPNHYILLKKGDDGMYRGYHIWEKWACCYRTRTGITCTSKETRLKTNSRIVMCVLQDLFATCMLRRAMFVMICAVNVGEDDDENYDHDAEGLQLDDISDVDGDHDNNAEGAQLDDNCVVDGDDNDNENYDNNAEAAQLDDASAVDVKCQ